MPRILLPSTDGSGGVTRRYMSVESTAKTLADPPIETEEMTAIAEAA